MGQPGACGGPLRSTKDGGRTWTPDASQGAQTEVIRFSSVGNAAWIGESQTTPIRGSSVLSRTTNGGALWQVFRRPEESS
jgi:hypothetical protein